MKNLRNRPTLPEYLTQLWRRRHFILAEARNRAFADGRDMFLGKWWVILTPLLQVLIYALVFGVILRTSRGIENFIGFLVIGVVFFRFFAKSISTSGNLIPSQKSMISSFRFPRASLVLSANLRNAFDSIPAAVVSVGIALAFQYDKPVSWTTILVIPIFVLLHLFNCGVSFYIARAAAFLPDLRSLIPLLVRALFFTSGIFFSIERFDTRPGLTAVIELSPYYQFLHTVRVCVLDGDIPPVSSWLYLSGWSILLCVTGLVYFWRAEEQYATVR